MLILGRSALLVPSKTALLATLALWLVCVGALCNSTYAQTRTETVLHDFSISPRGSFPNDVLVQDLAGNLYGTTSSGGPRGGGTVFQLAPTGALTLLYAFSEGGAEGSEPVGLVLDAAGNLYGATEYEGSGNCGGLYKISAAGKETILHIFQGGSDGCGATGALLLDASGNLYGVTVKGGGFSAGTVFKLDPAGNETILFSFPGIDYSEPNGNLVLDKSGNLIGTTRFGGSEDAGVIYRLTSDGRVTILHTFTGADGCVPNAGFAMDAAGNLYGTTAGGGVAGPNSCEDGPGVVFELDVQNNFKVLHTFHALDARNPNSAPILDQTGNLYGTAACCNSDHDGVVYQLSPAGQQSIVFSFTSLNSEVAVPSGLLLGSDGKFYGVNQTAIHRQGIVYSITPSGQLSVLYTFPNSHGGYFPTSNLSLDQSGNLWGVTADGYHGIAGQQGTVYKISPSGQETVLYAFGSDTVGDSGLVFDQAGNAYGELVGGEYTDRAAVYKITPAGEETTFFSFDVLQGLPFGGLVIDASGNLYGAAGLGYDDNWYFFKLDPAGNETILYRTSVEPNPGVALDAAGNLYGTNEHGNFYQYGVVFRITPDGQEQDLYDFTGRADGGNPEYGVVLDSAGNLYGTTTSGGKYGQGVVFELSGGVERVIFDFKTPLYLNPIILDAQGNIYGTSENGGTDNEGFALEISAEGVATVLHNFRGGLDGGQPLAGLLLGPSGALYGTASIGGKHSGGVVFELQ